MRVIAHHDAARYGVADLPLFEWAAQFGPPKLTNGGKYVHRRTGLPPSVANTFAELHGIGGGVTF